MADSPALVLASASPRRRELLSLLGVEFTCDPADIDESVFPAEDARKYVARMAEEKGRCVLARYRGPDTVVLAADTSVVIDGDVLGKPADRDDAHDMLRRLSGRTHEVLSAVSVTSARRQHAMLVATAVEFTVLSETTITAYLASDEPWDKAGAYAIQGLAGVFVRRIEGSYSNVVGLPLAETRELLLAAGIAPLLDRRPQHAIRAEHGE